MAEWTAPGSLATRFSLLADLVVVPAGRSRPRLILSLKVPGEGRFQGEDFVISLLLLTFERQFTNWFPGVRWSRPATGPVPYAGSCPVARSPAGT